MTALVRRGAHYYDASAQSTGLRIDRAKLLLETSTLSVDQIVKRVGYHDASALTRQFKLHTKLTPNQFRQRYGLSRAPRTTPGAGLTSLPSARP